MKNVYHADISWQEIPNIKIAVLGDVMLDKYMIGTAKRVSPEAPVLVVQYEKTQIRLGGAANVAHNISGLGANVQLFTVCGQDTAQDDIVRLAQNYGINCDSVFLDECRITTEKIRIVSQNQQICRVDVEEISPLSAKTEDLLLNKLMNSMDEIDLYVISDYQKGVCTDRLIKEIMRLTTDKNIPVIVDSKRKYFSIFQGALCVTPNVDEVSVATGIDICSDEELNKAAKFVLQMGIKNVLITQGARGMTLFEPDKKNHLPVTAKEIYDVSGAGDTVTAVLAVMTGLGLPLLKAAEIANLAAGIIVGKPGTSPIFLHELLSEWNDRQRKIVGGYHKKIMSPESISAYMGEQKAFGKKVVFTNGCFDLLHEGHLDMFAQCKALGDIVVVGLNTDSSVKRLKGPDRPINDERYRTLLLAHLTLVDAVCLFDEDTPENLIRLLRPDILVKGEDYMDRFVAGAEFVKSYGGKIAFIPLTEGKSTTNIINTIQNII